MQHNPKYLNNMCKTFIEGKYNFLIAVRDFSNFKKNKLSFTRFWSSFFFILFFNSALGKLTSDPMSGFFIFKKKFFIKKKLFGKGYKILADLLYSNGKINSVTDFKINFLIRSHGKSKINLRVVFYAILFIFRTTLKKFMS